MKLDEIELAILCRHSDLYFNHTHIVVILVGVFPEKLGARLGCGFIAVRFDRINNTVVDPNDNVDHIAIFACRFLCFYAL